MKSTRREWLLRAGAFAFTSSAARRPVASQPIVSTQTVSRIAAAIREYEEQGFHRTATAVDRASGDWLANQVRLTGLPAALESFPVNRVDPVAGTLTIDGRRIEGLPLFDGQFTSAAGIRGRLGPLGSNAEIGLAETAVNGAAAGALGAARKAGGHLAIVAMTKGRRPGLCPSNGDSFLNPFGPPVLQVSSEEETWLTEHARLGHDAQVVAHVERVAATATNVTAECRGVEPVLPPLVIMTPRSGWYWCGSERGGGIACWLEIMRDLAASPLRRSVLFVASSGHELGHLGIDVFIERRPGIVKNAEAWMHLGANIGAATDPANNLLQASDDGLDAALTSAMTSAGLAVARRAKRGTVPAGEAEAVHGGGGRYVSAIGGSALFHHLDDRGPGATDPAAIARFAAAFSAAARILSGRA